jgi:hypothetical protein
MEHRGIRYEVEEMIEPAGFIWTVHLGENGTKIGVSFSKENAIDGARRAVDKAVEP